MKNIKYLVVVPKGFEKNGEVAQKLMTIFEIGGVFSEILVKRVYDILYLTMYYLEKANKEKAYEEAKKISDILNNYNIFSNEFKSMIDLMVLEIIHPSN